MALFCAAIRRDSVSIIIIIIIHCEFYTPVLADSFSLESEGQQVFSSL